MPAFRLNTVLELRRRQENDAQALLADAISAHAEAKREEERLVAEAEKARARVASVRVTETARVADLQTAAQFAARLRDERAAAEMRLADFRAGRLRAAREAEETARGAQVAARQAREIVEKQLERHRAVEQAARERRQDDELQDRAEALGRGRRPK